MPQSQSITSFSVAAAPGAESEKLEYLFVTDVTRSAMAAEGKPPQGMKPRKPPLACSMPPCSCVEISRCTGSLGVSAPPICEDSGFSACAAKAGAFPAPSINAVSGARAVSQWRWNSSPDISSADERSRSAAISLRKESGVVKGFRTFCASCDEQTTAGTEGQLPSHRPHATRNVSLFYSFSKNSHATQEI